LNYTRILIRYILGHIFLKPYIWWFLATFTLAYLLTVKGLFILLLRFLHNVGSRSHCRDNFSMFSLKVKRTMEVDNFLPVFP